MPSRTRRPLAVLSTVAVLALPAAAQAASPQAPYPAPNHPSAVPERPGALTTGHPHTPADLEPALAQERYYGSYGDVSDPVRPATVATGDGSGGAALAVALAAALVVGIAAGSGLRRMHSRRRAPRVAA